jgi:hypothetical protein
MPKKIHGVDVTFDHEKYQCSFSFERTRILLAELIKGKEHTFSFVSRDDRNEELFYFRLNIDVYVLRVSAWRSDLTRLGIEIEALAKGHPIKGMAKLSVTDKGRLFVNFSLTDCQDYEGRIKIERSFEKGGIKHFVFTKSPSDGNQFVIKQPEFFPHGVINFFEPEGQGNVSIYEFQENKNSPREWKVKRSVPLWLNGEHLNQNHCAYEGIFVYDWYAHNQEVFSPFGKVNRNFHLNAMRNHSVCEVVTGGQAQMVFIPASLLKAKGLTRLEAGTRLRGVARYVLLDVFQAGHNGWLADNVEILDDDRDASALPKLDEPRVETLKFVCKEPNQDNVRVYTFASLDGEQTFQFKDYGYDKDKLIEFPPEPERYHFIVKIQPRGKFINIKEILSAELQS